ncbi:hypothetical protein [Saccharothrix deserti]|uniref:hypothetical protein n=1 Tax=Saccharothrix deserti TaxID=2593674 RepID=UPI00131DA66E|nr:hypothetical protein [Saccharothrix deserti]
MGTRAFRWLPYEHMTMTRDNKVVFGALQEEVFAHLDAACDIALEGDEHAAASTARAELPRLVAGLRVLLAQHVPDANGHCRSCRVGRWWRRTPVPCRVLLEYQLAVCEGSTHQPKHRSRKGRRQG